MSLSKSIAHNTLIQLLTKFFTIALGVIAFGMMARYLGTDGYGAYTIVTAYLQFFGIVVDMGLSIMAVQMMAEQPERSEHLFGAFFTLRGISAFIFIGIAPLLVLTFPYSTEVKVGVAIMAASFFCSSLIQLLTGLFQLRVAMLVPSLADLLQRVFLVGAIGGIAYLNGGFYAMCIAVLISNTVQFLILFVQSRRLIRIHWTFEWGTFKEIMGKTWPIACSIIFNLIYLKADTLIVAAFRSQQEAGIYGASYRVLEVLITIPMMILSLLLASFTNAWSSNDKPRFKRYVQKAFGLLYLLATPVMIVTWFRGEDIMRVVAGDEFKASGDVLGILVIGVAIVFMSSLYGYLINVINMQRTMMIGYATAAIVGLVGYFITIPFYGYWGAAWMTVVSEGIVLVFASTLFIQKTKVLPPFMPIVKITASSIGLASLLWLTQSWELFLSIVLGGIGYVLLLILLGVITRPMIKELLRF